MAFRVVQDCNWLQGLESSTDPGHVSYLHRLSPGPVGGALPGSDARMFSDDLRPRLSVEHTSYGARIHALRKMKSTGHNYLRVNNYLYPNGTTPVSSEPPPVGGYQGRWYVPCDDTTHCRFEFVYRREGIDKAHWLKSKGLEVGPDKRHVRRASNRYLQDRDEMKRDDTFAGMGRYAPAQDAFAIETVGAIQDRTQEHLGSTDIVIIEVRKALLGAIKRIEDGLEAPGILRDPKQNVFPDFICTADNIPDGEDGPGYCKRVLGVTPRPLLVAAE
jgi:hypothetical protein